MSALPPKADATVADRRVRFGPKADIKRGRLLLHPRDLTTLRNSWFQPTLTTAGGFHEPFKIEGEVSAG
jgi:hypothetical protein